MLVIIIYRLTDPKLRRKLQKLLLNFGGQIQPSVFELRLTTRQFSELLEQIKKLEPGLTKTDSIRIYTMCKFCTSKVIIFGKKKLSEDPLYYIV